MSDLVKSRGFIAVLTEPADHEKMHERFHADKSKLSITYDGRLVYFDQFAHTRNRYDIEGLQIGGYDAGDEFDPFIEELTKYGLKIIWGTSREYTCIWYNGSDSPMSELTIEEFQKSDSNA